MWRVARGWGGEQPGRVEDGAEGVRGVRQGVHDGERVLGGSGDGVQGGGGVCQECETQ